MDIKKAVRVHTCNQPSEGQISNKCRCRKYVSVDKAAVLVEDGYARNVIVSTTKIEIQEKCPICNGLDNLKKRCQNCKNTGVVSTPDILFEYSEDIYMRPFLKTPRTATIEEEHIEYAFIKNDRDAIKRIELYNDLTQVMLAELGAELINTRTKEVVMKGTPEPEDNPKTRTGRKYDWGRTI